MSELPTELPTPHEAVGELVDAMRQRRDAQSDLVDAVKESAKARSEYRRAKAACRLRLRAEHAESGEKVTVDDLSAMVDDECGAARFDAYIKEGLEYAAKRAVEQYADEVSAWQTVANAVRDEMRMTQTGGAV